MARKPSQLPAGLDRFVIVNGHAVKRIEHGLLSVEGTDGGGAVRVEDYDVPAVDFGRAERILVDEGRVLDVHRLECRLWLDDGSELVFREDLEGTEDRVRYATFVIHDDRFDPDEVEMIGALVLHHPDPLATRQVLPWEEMEILGGAPPGLRSPA